MQGQFWRDRAYYHRDRATTWRKTALFFAGVALSLFIALCALV